MKRLTLGFLIAVLITGFTFFSSNFLFAKQVKGVVFEDTNKNLNLDKGEKGIPGVLVSNQRDVVQTDKNGRFKISIEDETVIFITKPNGYMTPLNDKNLPQFYYIYQPKGSPELKYGGIEPTGKLPKSLNFPLLKTEEIQTCKVIAFSDPQPRDHQEVNYIRDDVIAELIGTDAVCGITLGDIMYDDLSLLDRYNQVVSQIDIPFYNVAGNHDENYDSPDDRYALETFKRHFGPTYYSFDYGKVHFIVLDDVEYLGKNEKGSPRYQGKLGEQQLQWLKNDLGFVDEDRLIVLTMHIPLYTSYSEGASVNVLDRDELFEILKDRERVLALAGHMHTLEHNFIGKEIDWHGENPLHQVICAAVSGTWWTGIKDERGIPGADQRDGTPNGYHIFKFEGNQYSEVFKPAHRDADFQLRISSPVGKISLSDTTKEMIIVNVFDGSERSKVKYKIDDSNFLEMQQTRLVDPFYQNFYDKNKDGLPSWIKPEVSTHIWTAQLPDDLKPGVHRIVVITTDQFGNKYETASIFEVE